MNAGLLIKDIGALMFAQKLCSTVGIVISATVPGLSMSSTTMVVTTTPTAVAVVTSLSGIVTSTTSPTYMGTTSTTSTSPMASSFITGTMSAPVAQYTGGAGHLAQELVAAVVAVGVLVAAF
jgi:hypothetical protein